jgi:tetratricopeptide (TPR) repeat protein
MKRVSAVLLVAVLTTTSCGYFNSLYNANRSFAEARSAERQGEPNAAVVAYNAAIENAASSYRGHGDSRWADDALLLIGRARYALGEYEASRAAFVTLLRERPDGGLAPDAHAWLGASEGALGNWLVAIVHLDSALSTGPSREADALARLWRARITFTHGVGDPWADLESAAASGTVFAPHATLTLAGTAIADRDTARARVAFDRLFRDGTAARWSDSIASLIGSMYDGFGAAFTRSAIEPVARGGWPAESREPHLLRRALLAAQAGDTTAAIADAIALADVATPANAARARLTAARLRLAGTDDVSRLDEVLAMLLPVMDDAHVVELVRHMRVVDVLLARANADQPLALFAAAETSRDELGAPALARRLFIMYADLEPAAVWAPKALLAAAALGGHSRDVADLAARVRQRPDNPYAMAILSGDTDAAAFEAAERRLSETLATIRRDAMREVLRMDTERSPFGRGPR